MRKILGAFLVFSLFVFPALAQRKPSAPPRIDGHAHVGAQVTVDVCFVPAQICDDLIVEKINAAKNNIRVQGYGFTSQKIIDALAKKKLEGKPIEIILDKSNGEDDPTATSTNTTPSTTKPVPVTKLVNVGVPTWIDYQPAIAHNKVIIIDDEIVIGGSYNYTSSAEHRNAENVTIMYGAMVAKWYTDNFESRKAVSMPFAEYRSKNSHAAKKR